MAAGWRLCRRRRATYRANAGWEADSSYTPHSVHPMQRLRQSECRRPARRLPRCQPCYAIIPSPQRSVAWKSHAQHDLRGRATQLSKMTGPRMACLRYTTRSTQASAEGGGGGGVAPMQPWWRSCPLIEHGTARTLLTVSGKGIFQLGWISVVLLSVFGV